MMSWDELDPSSGIPILADNRPRMAEPPPVRLIAVNDVRLVVGPGLVGALDSFYAGLLEFEREVAGELIVYRAENFRLRFAVAEMVPVARDAVRPTGILVKSLRDAERKLFNQRIEYIRQRGLLPGQISLLLQDPTGNWVELFEAVAIG